VAVAPDDNTADEPALDSHDPEMPPGLQGTPAIVGPADRRRHGRAGSTQTTGQDYEGCLKYNSQDGQDKISFCVQKKKKPSQNPIKPN
jgi:hypothetical protein